MDWSKYVMWTVVAALIAAVAGIIGALIRDTITISGKIGSLNNTTLSGQHSEIQKTVDKNHEKLEHLDRRSESLLESSRDIKQSVVSTSSDLRDIKAHLDQEAKVQNWRDKSLDSNQQEIKSSFDKMQGFMQNWQTVIAENGKLAAQNQKLTEQNAALTMKNGELTFTVKNLSEQMDDLKIEVNRLQQERGPHRRGPTLER